MRTARIKLSGRNAVYHCMSRIVGGQLLLDELCKETLVAQLRNVATFCGLEVLAYCMMSNHFHVLVRVPAEQNPSDPELLERMEALYGQDEPVVFLARQALAERGQIDADIRQSMLRRMGDLSIFMKEFKQRFSRWYNERHGRYGTLWAERFKSVLVEDRCESVLKVALYIDLNSVRAGLVADPKDYRFCGYAAALAGEPRAQAALMSMLQVGDWSEAAALYRQRLFLSAGQANGSDKAVLEPQRIRQVLAQGGRLGLGEVLRLHIRHMTDGLVLGSKGFVNEIFHLHREKFSKKRKDGARPIRGVSLEGMMAMRDLRVRAVE